MCTMQIGLGSLVTYSSTPLGKKPEWGQGKAVGPLYQLGNVTLLPVASTVR